MTETLEITTRLGCKIGCSFCPQGLLQDTYSADTKQLGFEEFVHILGKVPNHVQIHFSGFAEPFLNPKAAQMMRLASERGYKVHLYTTLVGLTDPAVELLKETKIEVVRIHIPDTKAMVIDSDAWIALHERFMKLNWKQQTYMAMGQVYEKVRCYLEDCGFEIEMPTMLSRGGNLWKPRNIQGPVKCGMERWHQNVLLPNGDVYACCMDYGLSMPLGNLLFDSYDTIWKKAEEYRLNTNPPSNSICRTCEWAAEA